MKRYGKKTTPRAGTGVRGNVEYRKISEQYVGQRNYPMSLFAVVNTLAVLLAVFVVLAAVWVFTPLREIWSLGREEEMTVEFTFYDADGAFSSQALEGTALFDAASDAVFGEITAVTARPLEKDVVIWQEGWESLPSDAPVDRLTYPVQLVTVTVRVKTRYRAADGYYTAWGEKLYVGGSYAVSLGGSLVTGYCVTLAP